MKDNKSKNLLVRSLSGFGLLVIMLGALFISQYTFLALLVVLCIGIMTEFLRLTPFGPTNIGKWIAYITGVIIIYTAMFANMRTTLCLVTPLTALIFFSELYHRKDNPLENIAVTIGAIIYAAIPMALLAMISITNGQYQPKTVLIFFITVWLNDVFAYLIGMSIGRKRLLERISPKKSWEGFWGGLLFATAFTAVAGHLTGGNIFVCGGFGTTVALSSVLGDLVESMFKRAANVKDSGNILPGHGGFMDRFDAMLLSLPFAYCYLTLLNPFTF